MKKPGPGGVVFLLLAGLFLHTACPAAREIGESGDFRQVRKLYLEGQYEEGLAAAADAYNRKQADLGGLCLYVRLLLLNGRTDEAEALIYRGLAIRADDSELLLLLGRAGYQSGRAAAALELLDRAASTTLLEEVYLERARIFLDFGEEEKAEASVRKALLLRGFE